MLQLWLFIMTHLTQQIAKRSCIRVAFVSCFDINRAALITAFYPNQRLHPTTSHKACNQGLVCWPGQALTQWLYMSLRSASFLRCLRPPTPTTPSLLRCSIWSKCKWVILLLPHCVCLPSLIPDFTFQKLRLSGSRRSPAAISCHAICVMMRECGRVYITAIHYQRAFIGPVGFTCRNVSRFSNWFSFLF